MILETIPLRDLSNEDYRRCDSLNARGNGCMRSDLAHCRRHSPTAIVCMAKEGNILLGWALVFPGGLPQRSAHFYVRKTHRGQGIGKMLMTEVLDSHKKIRVFPHDRTSAKFFKTFRKSVTTNRYNSWLSRV